jgi:hypothetical protein
VARVGGVVLTGEHEDLHAGGMREQVGDELEALVGTVRHRRQAEVDQRELGRLGQLAQQLDGVLARVAGKHLEVRAKREGEGLRDERVVVDDQQRRLRLGRGLRQRRHGYIS